MSKVFTFIDASHLIAKANLWQERDKAIKKKYKKLNKNVLPKVAVDKQTRIGCKGGSKYWYGYKKHVSVGMQSGLINKVAITPANMSDAKGMRHVCPNSGVIYADKGYCTQRAKRAAQRQDMPPQSHQEKQHERKDLKFSKKCVFLENFIVFQTK